MTKEVQTLLTLLPAELQSGLGDARVKVESPNAWNSLVPISIGSDLSTIPLAGIFQVNKVGFRSLPQSTQPPHAAPGTHKTQLTYCHLLLEEEKNQDSKI